MTTLLDFNAFPGSLSLYAFITLFCLESLNMLKRAVFYWSHTPRCKEVKKKKGDIIYIHFIHTHTHTHIIVVVASEFHVEKEMNVFVGKKYVDKALG